MRERCAAGLQFGSRVCRRADARAGGGLSAGAADGGGAEPGGVCGDAGVDKWTGNCNGRQAVFERKPRERKYRAMFIDQGFCFNAGDWTFPDAPLRGVFARNQVYARVEGGRALSRG